MRCEARTGFSPLHPPPPSNHFPLQEPFAFVCKRGKSRSSHNSFKLSQNSDVVVVKHDESKVFNPRKNRYFTLHHPLSLVHRAKYCNLKELFHKIVAFLAVLRIHIFWPLGSGSGSSSQRYRSGSGSYYHQAKIVRKTFFLLFCDFFLTFYL